MRICGICDEELKNDDKIVACNKCNGLYHLDCFENLGGCANPSCENYIPPSLSLAQLSQSDDATDEDCDVYYENPEDDPLSKEKCGEEWEFDEDYHNNYTVTSTENEDDYEISETDENDELGDTPQEKSIFQSVIEWLIFIGLAAVAFFLILMILE